MKKIISIALFLMLTMVTTKVRAQLLEEAKLVTSDGTSYDYFGYSVSIDGDYAIVGAYGYDGIGSSSGAAYIFKRDGENWSQQAKLTPSDGASSDYFGYSVAISGDYAIVGAHQDDYMGSNSGSAYIFEKPVSGWVTANETAKLTPSDGTTSDYFGYSVSIDGDYAIVGAYGDDDNGSSSGSAYIFEKPVAGWVDTTEIAKLTASDSAASDYFGYSVSIDGDYAIVGAYGDDDNGSNSGSAYIFEKPVSGWVDANETAKLIASDGTDGDYFGQSVSINGDYCVVGAHQDDQIVMNSGAAYMFVKHIGGWEDTTETVKLTPSDGASSDYFGCSVSIDGEYAIVGAYGDDDKGSSSGSAYTFSIVDFLAVTAEVPPEDFISSGYEAGPFEPPSKTYTLINFGPNPLNWTASTTQSWLDITPGAGTLNPGDFNTVVVSLTADVNNLLLGDYNDLLTFTNTTSGYVQTKDVMLQVFPEELIAYFSMDSNPGWSTEGQWEFGIPLGGGSYCGDPTSGHTGENVYGYNLAGNYTNYMPEYYLTTTALECSDHENVTLSFWRWLGVQSSYYDHAKVEVSNNGSNWTMVWEHTGNNLCDGAWVECEYDISDVADGQPSVYVRWTMGPTSSSTYYPGWNIDDVLLSGDVMDDFRITPREVMVSSGYEGGPFEPDANEYTLTNAGSGPLDWTASATQSWLNVTPGAGTLNPGDFNTVVVSLTADVNNLPPGDYNDLVIFINTTSGSVQTRDVVLEVIPFMVEMEVIDSIPPVNDLNMPFGDVFIGLSHTEKITITNTDPNFSLVITDISIGHRYFEDFNDGEAQGWDEDVDVDWSVVSGEYQAYQPTPTGTDSMVATYGGEVFGDFTYEVKTRRPNGIARYMLFRTTPDLDRYPATGSTYAFGIDGGSYFIFKQVSGVTTTLVSWTYSSYINPDVEWNTLKVIANGSELTFYINNNFVRTLSDTSLTEGRIGLLGYTGTSSYFSTHYFDNVFVADLTMTLQTISPEQQWYNNHPYEGGSPETAPDDWTPPEYPGEWEISPIELTNSSKGGFQLEGCPSLPLTVPPLGSVDVNVAFRPTDVEDYEALVVINSSNASELELQLIGAGILDYLEVVPEEDIEFSGHPGGPFVPSSTSYQLTNSGPVSIDWTVDGPNWVDVSSLAGTLKSGESTIVTVEWNSIATTKQEGVYDANLMFSNLVTTVVHERSITLNVHTNPKIWARPLSFDVAVPQGGSISEALTIGNTGDSALGFSFLSRQTGFNPPQQQKSSGVSSMVMVSAPPGHDFSVAADAPFASGELLVRFAPENDGGQLNIAQKESILQSLDGASIKAEYSLVPGLSLVELPEGATVEDALVAYNGTNGILYAQPNYEVNIVATFPDDSRFNELWGMHNNGQSGGKADADIDAPEAWDMSTGASDIILAVIDTGVDYTHPDLAENMWVNEDELNGEPGVDDDDNGYVDDIYGYDFVNNDGDPMDDHYHGTHCAGTVGASGNNGVGVAGVCWNVKIMALKFLNSSGSGWTSDAIAAVEYSSLMGAKLSSNSWGGGGYSQALRDTIEAAGNINMLFVAAVGNGYGNNNDTNPHYPSSYDCDSIIAVMSTDRYDNVSVFSNYGPTSVDIGAPGSDILSCQPGGGYQYLGGTSMATPHVAGACALVWSFGTGLSNQQIKGILLNTIDTIPTLDGLCVSDGRLNVSNAILEARVGWIDFVPDAGTIAPQSANDVDVVFFGEQSLGTYQGEIIIHPNDPYATEVSVPVTMTVEPVDYFTELFEPDPFEPNDPNDNDMVNRTLTFIPDESWSYYNACSTEAVDFPVDPTGGNNLLLDDDDYEKVSLESKTVNLYGTEYETFYICSNGYISFTSGDLLYMETFADHFALPRISALFDDLDPSAGGTISWKQLTDRIAVTFENVPEYNLFNSNNFQVEMFFNGTIRITWLEIAAVDGLVGLSQSDGISPYFSESNLSEYSLLCDLDDDCDVDFIDYASLGRYWFVEDCNSQNNWCEGADFEHDGDVDWTDLGEISLQWLMGTDL